MRHLRLVARMALAIPTSAAIGVMAWYLWLQEEYLNAYDEYTR